MVSKSKPLSDADVKRLLSEPSEDNRADTAAKVAASYTPVTLTDSERELAEGIFRLLMKDAAARVRKALSASLSENPDIPQDVAVALANDVEDVALPMVQKSAVLLERDLIQIVKGAESSAVQEAVAGRDDVTELLSEVIADTGSEAAVAVLMANAKAQINEKTFDKVVRKFGDSEKVQAPLSARPDLPLNIAERLVSLVSENLRVHLQSRYNIDVPMSEKVLQESRERAVVSLLNNGTSTQSVIDLVRQIHDNGRLTPSLLIRALCTGDMTFFEAGLAHLVGIPTSNAYRLVRDKGDLGLTRLFQAAKMPDEYLPIAREAIQIADETAETVGDDRRAFRNIMIERVLTQMEDQMDGENLAYLINKLSPDPAGAAR